VAHGRLLCFGGHPILLFLFFDDALVGRQRFGPEQVKLFLEGAQPFGIDPVDAAITDVLIHHEASLLEDLQVL